MTRPYPVPGVGWGFAVIVAMVAVLALLGVVALTASLAAWLLLGLAAAILL